MKRPKKPANPPETNADTPKPGLPKLLLTAPEAAAMFSISERKLFALTKSGEIACRYVGRGVRYVPEELVAWRDGLPREKR